MSASIRATLPPVYQPLFAEPFDRPAIVESRATCEDCAMCDKGAAAPVAMAFFHPETKCCTYNPYLPNYLVGAILSEKGPDLDEGRKRIRERIASRIGVGPQWLSPPRKFTLLMTASQKSGAFGRSNALVCPYYDKSGGGKCTIWKHRDSVCTTWFCKFTGGQRGAHYWKALKDYLAYVQVMLSRYAAKSIDPSLGEPQLARFQLTIEDLEDRAPKTTEYASYWRSWIDREEEFYVACHAAVAKLTKKEFAAHVDDTEKGKKLLAALAAAHEATNAAVVLPSHLVRSRRMSETAVDGAVVVTTYSPFDSFTLDKELYEVLGLLKDDEPLDAALARLEKDHDVELAPELLQQLYVFGVLVAPDPPKK